MADRLYYSDSYCRQFEATVLESRTGEHGRAVILDRTAFYPSSGGQPYDQGWLGVARVLQVEEEDSGEILHYIEGDLPNGAVSGNIDWERRFDHMQQHSGQHLLSQAFVSVASAPTVSFHLGRDISTIDIDIAAVTPDLLAAVSDEANRIVFENRPLHVRFVAEEQVGELNLRKEPARRGTLRIIEIEQYDRSACGGTHVRSTGELGLVLILGAEKYKSYFRVEFVCGWRALRLFRREHDILKSLGRQLSTGPAELAASFEKITEENKAQKQEIRDLNERLNKFEAELLFQTAEKRDGIWVIKALLAASPANTLKSLASELIKKGPCLVLLASAGESAFIVLANSSPRQVDCATVLGQALQLFGGRGGGRPELAQGGGIPAERAAELVAAVYDNIFHKEE